MREQQFVPDVAQQHATLETLTKVVLMMDAKGAKSKPPKG